jgi:prepilin-type N-terminal cleavage/methylation domain-containing protein
MKSPRTKISLSTNGFSLLEVTIVLALMLVMASVSFISLQPMLRQQRVNNAYNTVLSAMRLARDNSVAQRTSYVVTLDSTTTPHTVKVEPTFAGTLAAVTYKLPDDVKFFNVTGIPTNPTKTPDGFGTGAKAIDFGFTGSGTGVGGSTKIYFCPDGSAQDAVGGVGQCSGTLNNGVVYIARSTELMSSRAITIWGATGRIRGWRIYNKGGVAWQRQ